MKKIAEIISEIRSSKIAGNTDKTVSNIQFDSRKVEAGNLFVATRGMQVDGHDYIEAAIEKGAVAIVCEVIPAKLVENITYIQVENSLDALGHIASAWFDYPSEKLLLVGVTGTNGKTTVATLLYEMFRKLGYKAGLLSTVVNYIDDQAVEATLTTPYPLEINELLAKMVDAGCKYAFMEVSSHSVVLRRIAGLKFAGGIFTNLSQDHLDFHKTMPAYRDAKKRFFDDLPSEAFVITNLDDKNGMVMLQNTKAKKYTYSIRSISDFKTKVLESSFEGMLLEMNDIEVHVPFIGKFNAYNLTAVFGTAVLLGKSKLEVLTALSSLHSVSGRFETLRADKGFTAIVDYSHTPDALNNVIGTINQILQNSANLITVVGCGGDRDKSKRPLMAREAIDGSNRVIFTSDNPRSENPQEIINDMLAGLSIAERNNVLCIVDRREAIKTACALAQKGDVVLVAGKGHENYQIIGKEKFHFDDKEEILKIVSN